MISEWTVSSRQVSFVRATNIQPRLSNGKTRWTADLSDASGTISAVDWGCALDGIADGFIKVEGLVGQYLDEAGSPLDGMADSGARAGE